MESLGVLLRLLRLGVRTIPPRHGRDMPGQQGGSITHELTYDAFGTAFGCLRVPKTEGWMVLVHPEKVLF